MGDMGLGSFDFQLLSGLAPKLPNMLESSGGRAAIVALALRISKLAPEARAVGNRPLFAGQVIRLWVDLACVAKATSNDRMRLVVLLINAVVFHCAAEVLPAWNKEWSTKHDLHSIEGLGRFVFSMLERIWAGGGIYQIPPGASDTLIELFRVGQQSSGHGHIQLVFTTEAQRTAAGNGLGELLEEMRKREDRRMLYAASALLGEAFDYNDNIGKLQQEWLSDGARALAEVYRSGQITPASLRPLQPTFILRLKKQVEGILAFVESKQLTIERDHVKALRGAKGVLVRAIARN